MKNIIEKNDSRLSWIDYSKGIGIVLVVYGHVIRGLASTTIISDHYIYYSDNFIYSFHMPLFFVLSGYLFYNSYKKVPSIAFIYAKLKTLIYPFIIWSILQTVIEIFLSKFTNTQTPPSALLTCLFLPRAQFWFLFALFFITVIAYLCFKASEKYGLGIILALWAVYFIFQPSLGPFDKAFQYLIFFFVGICISRQPPKFPPVNAAISWLLLTATLFTAAIYFYFIYSPKSKVDYGIWFILTGIFGSALIAQLADRAVSNKVFTFFVMLGKKSLPIYLVHIMVASGTRIILMKIFKLYNPAINVLTATIAGVMVPLLVYNYCSKTRHLAWLFNFPAQKKKEPSLVTS